MPAPEARPATGPLHGFRIGVTASRKAEEQIGLLERRGAEVTWAPVLRTGVASAEDEALRAATAGVLAEPVDLLVATTGVGMKAWLAAAEQWGMLPALRTRLDQAEIIARGPKTVGALRAGGLRELWSPDSECFEDVLAHLRGRDLAGRRIVVQEHGQSLSMVAHALRRQGAEVQVVTVYRVEAAPDPAATFHLVDLVADQALDAVTFTAAPAVKAFLEAAEATGRHEEVLEAFRTEVVAASVGPVTASALQPLGVPTVWPTRSRLAAMVTMIERELPSRRSGVAFEVCGGHLLRVLGDRVLVDGEEARLTPAPQAVLRALLARPGHVVGRAELLRALPSGTAGSEHAVEMAVARLRGAIGPDAVQTVVKRGYRLALA
ncbi:uroporphyrinogen-III synthase [Nocardioides campestrisoli]|uniref:uroporphyrinogen-III synthase n=1 Tax=Nocardioides campestrisoli TaxID=2736757 RepID=UPI00163D9FA7|nr:uroporphyrinogen-III synthase [Nocardioides campestrisoli]